MNTPSTPMLPVPHVDTTGWMHAMNMCLTEYFRNIYLDLRQGRSTHRVVDAVPDSDDLDEGEIVFFDDGADFLIYTKLNGTLRSGVLS